MAGYNSRWRKGRPRALATVQITHPYTGEQMSETRMVERYAREPYGWRGGARVVPPGGRSMRRTVRVMIEQSEAIATG